MNIKDSLRNRLKTAEIDLISAIRNIITDFEEETGFKIKQIDINHIDITTIMDYADGYSSGNPKTKLNGVKISMLENPLCVTINSQEKA